MVVSCPHMSHKRFLESCQPMALPASDKQQALNNTEEQRPALLSAKGYTVRKFAILRFKIVSYTDCSHFYRELICFTAKLYFSKLIKTMLK